MDVWQTSGAGVGVLVVMTDAGLDAESVVSFLFRLGAAATALAATLTLATVARGVSERARRA